MDRLIAKTSYHATMLAEPLTGLPLDETSRIAFERNFRVRVAETGDDIILEAAAKRFQCAVCLADVDRNPTPEAIVAESLSRLLLRLPVGSTLSYPSQAHHDFIAALREELGYLWRRRLEGLANVKRGELWAENVQA